MKRITPLASLGNPWLAWSELARKTGEMMLASAQVIQHRTMRIAAAGARPSARDRREFALMGQEKIDAALASAQAMAANMATMNAQLGIRGFEQMMTGAAAWTSLASSRTSGQALARQARLLRVMSGSDDSTSKLSRAAARLFESGMGPIHARATANARRLSRYR